MALKTCAFSIYVVDDDDKDEDDDDDDDDDSDDKLTKPPPIKGENVQLTNTENNRLGMGGLKALEKVNTLIKQSDGGHLTDDQEKAIERMIIGGLEDTQKKNVDVKVRNTKKTLQNSKY